MSNLVTIYSPKGEKHEVSKPNFIDLSRHYGWTGHPPIVAKKADEDETLNATAAITPVASVELPNADAGITDEPEDVGNAIRTESESDSSGTDGVLTGAEEKSNLIAELKARFDYDADKRLSFSKLMAKFEDLQNSADSVGA